MFLSSRALGLGLLTTLVGSLGVLLPVQAAPEALGTAADLETAADQGAVVDALTLPLPESAPSDLAPSNLAPSTPGESVWDSPERAIADATILPLGYLPTAATESTELPGTALPLANRSENSELFEFNFDGDQ
ncbi:MAG: hypothetical protein DCF21_21880, partial [Leptolyngbya sp.]